MSPIDQDHHSFSKEFDGPPDLSGMDRRDFMRYLGLFSSMTLLSHCSKKAEKIIPFPKEISEFTENEFEYYTSAVNHRGFAQGVLVKSYQGRPIKLEGNSEHPLSLGATTPEAQAAPFDLFHPERLKDSYYEGKKKTLAQVKKDLRGLQESWKDGDGLAFIYPATHSPTLLRLVNEMRKKYPKSTWLSFSPWKEKSFTHYDLKKARTVVSFDEELFTGRPDSLKLSREFMEKRRVAIEKNDPSLMNRLIVIESRPTLLGAKADDLWKHQPSVIWNWALDLYSELKGEDSRNFEVKKIAGSLKKENGVFIIRGDLHPDARALEEKINSLLKSKLSQSYEFPLPETHSLVEFKKITGEGKIHTLITMDSDPVYWDVDFKELFKKVKTRISLSSFMNETHELSRTKVPLSHWLEFWGDLEDTLGNITIQQPLISPLYKTISLNSFLTFLLGSEEDELKIVRATHKNVSDSDWEKGLQRGLISGRGKITQPLTPKNLASSPIPRWEMVIQPDQMVGYGEHSQNPLLQELPKSFYRFTWSNAFIISSDEGAHLGIKTEEMIKIKLDDRTIKGPVVVSPFLPKGVIHSTLGYGQKAGTKLNKKRGFSAYPLRGQRIISVEKTSGKKDFAFTQTEIHMDSSLPVKSMDFPLKSLVKAKAPVIKSLYPKHPLPVQNEGPQWGMTIDLTSCIGCETCVSACQVENNIPFVGEDQVRKKRNLHWIRIDNYLRDGKTFFQPVPCMHCEKAPCEVVCPVNATVHGNGGLNEMIYNRCVGTRYCSNNCPYKVRRFNFKAYSNFKSPWNLGLNPEVSVRDRGVMEKCTFCIQKIKRGERKDNQVKTACQEVCPTEAIVFDDLKQKDSKLVKQKESSRNYDLLEEEGTKPRTSYLKVVRIDHGV